MSMMPYVSPEQLMKDKADYARKGIARGRSVVSLTYADGLLLVAENPSRSLHKVSEIYDRIGFAAVGKYNEFESLRRQGIRLADVTGYQYARSDVSGQTLANAYANALGAAFTESSKPFEVELLVGEVTPEGGIELFHILYDGSIAEQEGYVAIGGRAEAINTHLAEGHDASMDRDAALRLARDAIAAGEDNSPNAGSLEVAGLDRTRGRRKFFRLGPGTTRSVFGEDGAAAT